MKDETLELLLNTMCNHLNITWQDDSTDEKIKDYIQNGVSVLNGYVGKELDYTKYGIHRELLINYVLYAWNEQIDEFKTNYFQDILYMQMSHYSKIEQDTS